MIFENDEARREHFLTKLREGLEELHAKLGGVPFTTLEDAVARLKSLEKWPVGDDERIRELAERMSRASRVTSHGSNDSRPATRDLLIFYKDEVGFPACAAKRSGAAGRRRVSDRADELCRGAGPRVQTWRLLLQKRAGLDWPLFLP